MKAAYKGHLDGYRPSPRKRSKSKLNRLRARRAADRCALAEDYGQ